MYNPLLLIDLNAVVVKLVSITKQVPLEKCSSLENQTNVLNELCNNTDILVAYV